MSRHNVQLRRRPRRSLTNRDLVPDLGVAVGSVALTVGLHWATLPWLGEGLPLLLLASTAAALTSWRGLGSGMLASSLGTTVASVMFIQPIHTFGVEAHKGSVPVEALLMFGSSMFVCWLIYRVRAEQEDHDAVHVRQNDALAFVSHELRHPLATVQLAASMLERDRSEETRARATKLILSSAARLGRVVDDLVDVTRLQREELRINSAVLRLQDPILAAVEAAAPAIAQRQQCLEAVVATTPSLWVNGDEGRLQQVFENLLSNASRYSPEGAEITVTSRQEGTAAVVTVRDTGLGVSQDMLERIFDPFVRENGSVAEGLGIGLTLVRNLVNQHGGHITASSDGPGRGSTFTIELPLVAGPAMAAAPSEMAIDRSPLKSVYTR
jgi:signal transduction histidine kinase